MYSMEDAINGIPGVRAGKILPAACTSIEDELQKDRLKLCGEMKGKGMVCSVARMVEVAMCRQ